MRLVRIIFLLCCLGSLSSLAGQNLVSNSKEVKLMGCRFVINTVAETDQQSWDAINKGIAEIERIENLISSWDRNSQTSLINQNAGIRPVKVDEELFHLIQRSLKISALTQGAFDISFAAMDRIYSFNGEEQSLPSQEIIDHSKAKINWQKIIVDKEAMTVFLVDKGMKIGFGSIGKGYAANQAKTILDKMPGVKGGVINASGDLFIWGVNPKGKNQKNIKISDPQKAGKILADINVTDTAVVTSGDYEKYFMNKGVRYAHIIDPKTGLPTTGIKSVTIICPDAELADALATSVFVLGTSDGLYLINQLKGVDAIILDSSDQLHHSKELKLNYN